ncbi:hypothetical protein J6590_048056 [Homalodisca vitripennis]|nr:hypothetical protein J6590_048056 [Homalodisca vitripennis]
MELDISQCKKLQSCRKLFPLPAKLPLNHPQRHLLQPPPAPFRPTLTEILRPNDFQNALLLPICLHEARARTPCQIVTMYSCRLSGNDGNFGTNSITARKRRDAHMFGRQVLTSGPRRTWRRTGTVTSLHVVAISSSDCRTPERSFSAVVDTRH